MGHVKYTERKKGTGSIGPLRPSKGASKPAVLSSLWGACVRFQNNFTAAESSEIRYATPLMTRSYAVVTSLTADRDSRDCAGANALAISERLISDSS